MAQPTARHEGDQDGEEGMAFAQPRFMSALLAHTHGDHQNTQIRWWRRSLSGDFQYQPLVLSTHPHVHAKSLLSPKLRGFKKSDSNAPSSSSSFSTHLQTVAAECSRTDSEVHFRADCLPHPKSLIALTDPLKSSAVLLCAVEESNSCKLAHWFSSWWI